MFYSKFSSCGLDGVRIKVKFPYSQILLLILRRRLVKIMKPQPLMSMQLEVKSISPVASHQHVSLLEAIHL